jgi:hypothetical protein
MVLQCRGHGITEGMQPQYDLFKQWTAVKRPALEAMLGSRFTFYGEWLYAKHSVHYRALPYYFFEFDLYDKDAAQFLDLDTRQQMLDGTGLHTVPVLHRGPATAEELHALIGQSAFDSAFDNPVTGRTDHLMEGLYVPTEAGGQVTGRAKMVRPEFVETVKQSEHWQHERMIPNLLAGGADIWA